MADAAEERLIVALEARIRDFERNMARGRKVANDNLAAIEKRAQDAAPRLEAAMSNAGKGLASGLSMGLGAVGIGGAGIAGVLSTIKQAVSEVAQMSAEAKRAGLGVEVFQELKYAAEQARVGVDGLTDGIKEMQLRADEFIVTGAGGGAEAFQRLGYTADELKAKLKDPAALFAEIIERLRDLDKASQIRVSDEIFGGTGGEQFVQFLEMGRNSIERMRQDARDTGAVLDAEMVKRAEDIDRRFQSLATTIGTKVKGAILGIIELLQEMQKHLPTPEELPQRGPAWAPPPAQATPRTRATSFDVGLPAGSPPADNVPLPTPRPAGLAGQGDLSNIKTTGAADALKRGYADLQAAARQRIIDLQTEQAALGMTTQAAEAYRFKQHAIAEAQRMQIELTPQQTEDLDALAQQYGAVSAAIENTIQRQQGMAQLQQEFGSIALNTFSGLIDGTQSWSDALGNAAKRLAEMALQATLLGQGPLASLMGGGGGGGGLIGTLFSIGTSLLGFAEGGVMTPQGPRPLKRYASGGVSRTAAIFGEAGPEAAVPLPDGRRIPVDLRTGGAAASPANVQVKVNVQALPGTTADVKSTPTPDGGVSLDVIMRQIKSEMSDDFANRGPMARAIESSYLMRRV